MLLLSDGLTAVTLQMNILLNGYGIQLNVKLVFSSILRNSGYGHEQFSKNHIKHAFLFFSDGFKNSVATKLVYLKRDSR